MLPEPSEYLLDMFSMLGEVVGVNENVIQIDDGRKHQLDLKKLCSMRWKVDRALVSPSKITNHLNEL